MESRLMLFSRTQSPLICVRILGWLIYYAPTDTGRSNIAREVEACGKDYQKVMELGAYYNDHLLRCCELLLRGSWVPSQLCTPSQGRKGPHTSAHKPPLKAFF